MNLDFCLEFNAINNYTFLIKFYFTQKVKCSKGFEVENFKEKQIKIYSFLH